MITLLTANEQRELLFGAKHAFYQREINSKFLLSVEEEELGKKEAEPKTIPPF